MNVSRKVIWQTTQIQDEIGMKNNVFNSSVSLSKEVRKSIVEHCSAQLRCTKTIEMQHQKSLQMCENEVNAEQTLPEVTFQMAAQEKAFFWSR